MESNYYRKSLDIPQQVMNYQLLWKNYNIRKNTAPSALELHVFWTSFDKLSDQYFFIPFILISAYMNFIKYILQKIYH